MCHICLPFFFANKLGQQLHFLGENPPFFTNLLIKTTTFWPPKVTSQRAMGWHGPHGSLLFEVQNRSGRKAKGRDRWRGGGLDLRGPFAGNLRQTWRDFDPPINTEGFKGRSTRDVPLLCFIEGTQTYSLSLACYASEVEGKSGFMGCCWAKWGRRSALGWQRACGRRTFIPARMCVDSKLERNIISTYRVRATEDKYITQKHVGT